MKNACVVGWGAIGPIHALAIGKTESAKLYAVCDIDPKRLALCKEEHSDVVTYDDFDTMLTDPSIDSVHICTPHYLHFEMIKKALAAGKKVVAEKPVTMTKEEYFQLRDDDFCVIIQNRLNPCIRKIKEIADNKTFGEVVAIRALITWCRDAEYYASGDWRGKWATEGGGVLINQAIHTLDYIPYITGGIKSVRSNMMNYSLEGVIEVEDTVVAYLDLCGGAHAFFLATNSYKKDSPPLFEVEFEKGTVRYMDNKLYVNGEEVTADDKCSHGKSYWGSSHLTLIKNFYDENKYFTAKDIENTMLSLFAIYESAKTGKEVTI